MLERLGSVLSDTVLLLAVGLLLPLAILVAGLPVVALARFVLWAGRALGIW